jgi:hypothetical protein
MHAADNAEVFRRHPRLGIALGAIVLAIGVGGFLAEYQDYRGLGDAPRPITLSEADAAPDATRWVTLTDPVTPDCNSRLQEQSGGSVTGTRYLASDAGGERWVYLRLHGDVPCAASLDGAQGILKRADSGLPAWLKEHGVQVPASRFPLMELSVGDDPGSIKVLLWCFTFLIALGAVSVVTFLVLQSRTERPRQSIRLPPRPPAPR